MREYHDEEWGGPAMTGRHLFELLSLEIMQAGLSWQTVLNKRAAFKQALLTLTIGRCSRWHRRFLCSLENTQIIRNRLKVTAIINNARVIAQLAAKGEDFDHYVWPLSTISRFGIILPVMIRVPNTTDLPST